MARCLLFTWVKRFRSVQWTMKKNPDFKIIKIRKLNPNAGRGMMMGGYHMGYGYTSPEDSCWR